MYTVILPVLDEATAIPGVLASLPIDCTPLVVDNGSRDESARVATEHGARVVVEPRRGFGAACFTGLVAATTDIVSFMDCDGSFDGNDLARVIEPVARGDADLVVGARQPTTPGAWPWHARLANRVLVTEIRRRTGVTLRDLGPMRAARRASLLQLGLVDRRFGWPLEMVLRAAAAGWAVDEVPVAYSPRIGRSKVTGTLVGTARTTRDMVHAFR
jgi:glycosyltransferase involved in cell wall biosynthesis